MIEPGSNALQTVIDGYKFSILIFKKMYSQPNSILSSDKSMVETSDGYSIYDSLNNSIKWLSWIVG